MLSRVLVVLLVACKDKPHDVAPAAQPVAPPSVDASLLDAPRPDAPPTRGIPGGEMTGAIHNRLNNLPRPIEYGDEVEAVGFYGDGAGAPARKGSRVKLTLTVWNAVAPGAMDAPPDPSAAAISKVLTITIGKAQLGRMVDAIVVPDVREWVMRKGAVRRVIARPNQFSGLDANIPLDRQILVELKML